MHVYIYDDFLDKSKYKRSINRIETRLTDLGLNGKIIRLGVIKNVKEALRSEIKRGAKTIVVVGNNESINKIINAILSLREQLETKVVFAIIPVGNNNSIAQALGIKNEEEACNIILARRIKKLDLGRANKTFFLAQATIENKGTSLDLKKNCTISAAEGGNVYIINMLTLANFSDLTQPIPTDGKLDLYIDNRGKDTSYFSIKKAGIKNTNKDLVVDNAVSIKCPVNVEIADNQITMIVGKERKF